MKTGFAVLAGAALLLAPAAWAQEASEIFAISQGRALYITHCVGCHGAHGFDAKGNPLNKHTGTNGEGVPDLALIVVRDGSFSAVHVGNHLNGRQNPAGRTRTMPCWNAHFTNEWPNGDTMAALKVFWLAKYLDTVQETSATASARR